MNLLQVVVMSIVEGVTEFLPVSSTGHLIMTARVMQISQTEFVKSFEIAIQLGAIMAVALLYTNRLRRNFDEVKKVAAAFVPTAIIGFAGYGLIKTFLLGSQTVTAVMLFAGGVLIVALDKAISDKSGVKKITDLSYKQAMIIGVIQAMAVVPGVSRALVTIWGGMGMGLSKKDAIEMSFLLAIPTMAAATGYDLLKSGWQFTGEEWTQLAVGLVVSMVVALVAVKWFLGLVLKKGMTVFGWYRIIAAGCFWILTR